MTLTSVNPLVLPDAVALLAELPSQFGLHQNGQVVRHGIEALVELREETDAVAFHEARGVIALLMSVESLLGDQSRHANVHAWKRARDIATVRFGEFALECEYVWLELDHVKVVVRIPPAHLPSHVEDGLTAAVPVTTSNSTIVVLRVRLPPERKKTATFAAPSSDSTWPTRHSDFGTDYGT